jgi:hypothetical protein
MCYYSEKPSTVSNKQADNGINAYQMLYITLDLLDVTLILPYFTTEETIA